MGRPTIVNPVAVRDSNPGVCLRAAVTELGPYTGGADLIGARSHVVSGASVGVACV